MSNTPVYGRRPRVFTEEQRDSDANRCVKVKQLARPSPTTWDTAGGPLPMWSYNEMREWEMQQEMNQIVREGRAPRI